MSDRTHTEPTPTKPFRLQPDGRVSTDWKTLGAVIVGTAILVGGVFSVKADIAAARSDAKQALDTVRDVRSELTQLRIALGLFDRTISLTPSAKTKEATP